MSCDAPLAARPRDVDRLAICTNYVLERNDFPCRIAASSFDGQLAMFATRDIAAGQRVIIERPFVLTLTPDARPFTCAACFADSRARHPCAAIPKRWPRRCAGCKVLRFCSEACEVRIEQRHRGSFECAALGAIAREELAEQRPIVDPLAENMLAQALRLLADRHAAVRVEALCGLTVAYPDGAARLLSVARSWPPPALIEEACDVALRFVPPEARVPAEELGDLLRRQLCNVYGVSSVTGSDVGRATFVGAMHLFNHSCAPNLTFESMPVWAADCKGLGVADCDRADGDGASGPAPLSAEEASCDAAAFSLVTLREVPCGAELTIAYVDTDSDRDTRRAHLLKYYGFECACERCVPATSPATEELRAKRRASLANSSCALASAQHAQGQAHSTATSQKAT
jgi:hypothetical protein